MRCEICKQEQDKIDFYCYFRPSYEGRDLELDDSKSSVSLYKRDYYVHGDDNNNEEQVDRVQKSVQTVSKSIKKPSEVR